MRVSFQKRFLTNAEAASILGDPAALREAVLFHGLTAYADFPIVVSNPHPGIPRVPVTHAVLTENAARICAAKGSVHTPFLYIGNANSPVWLLEASVAGDRETELDSEDGQTLRGDGVGFLLDAGDGATFAFDNLCFLSADIARLLAPSQSPPAADLETRERTSVHRIIAALAVLAKLPTERYKAASVVQATLAQGGVKLGESTIAKYLTAAEEQMSEDSRNWPPSQ